MVPPPPQCRPPRPPCFNLGTYNIRYIRGFVLPQAIQVVQLGNYDLMLLTDTNILNKTYYHNHLGYNVVCSQAVVTATGGEKWGVGLAYSGPCLSDITYPRPLLTTFCILSRH